MVGYVYIIQSLRNGRYYVGSTDDIERRLDEHNRGKSKYTSESGPWELVFKQDFADLSIARKVESKLKLLKSRMILEKIIKSGVCNIRIG